MNKDLQEGMKIITKIVGHPVNLVKYRGKDYLLLFSDDIVAFTKLGIKQYALETFLLSFRPYLDGIFIVTSFPKRVFPKTIQSSFGRHMNCFVMEGV